MLPTASALHAALVSLGVVALAEVGDRTMLLAIILAARFRRPAPVILGIFAATLANHAVAALVGKEAAWLLDSFWFKLVVALGFIAMAGWTLIPDKLDDTEEDEAPRRGGAFLTTLVTFFLVEIGDKTQIATIALGARFGSVVAVAAGTTLGMMLVNVPAVLAGERIMRVVPLRLMHLAAGALLAGVGVWSLAALFR